MLAESLREVLDCAAHFATSATAEMARRDLAVRRVTDDVEVIVRQQLGVDADVLSVGLGGRQSNYSPVPWVRLFDRTHSPTAMAGYYVVFLFAADGSAVYLSLNQGTSEWRANKWRPITDPEVLRQRAALGRRGLSGWDSRVLRMGETVLDLRASLVNVGAESRQRVRNYELANVAAYRYEVGALPDDETVANDLAELITLLWELQGSLDHTEEVRGVSAASSGGSVTDERPVPKVLRRASGQGRRVDAKANKACEMHAVAAAIAHFKALGWEDVQHVGDQGRPYDLECRSAGRVELRVEVKGTSSRGEEVILTPNEVDHALAYEHVALAIMSEITVHPDYTAEGGRLRVIDPWMLDRARLRPTEFVYRVEAMNIG